MKNLFFVLPILASLAGCVTVNGTYVVSAYDANGTELGNKVRMIASGSGIYTIRNAFCSKYPRAIVRIKDATSGEELKSESPYQCS